jgi:hypothetical protein
LAQEDLVALLALQHIQMVLTAAIQYFLQLLLTAVEVVEVRHQMV